VYHLLLSSYDGPDGFVFRLNAGRLCEQLGNVVHLVVDDIERTLMHYAGKGVWRDSRRGGCTEGG